VPCVQFVPQGAATTACKPHLPGIYIGFIDTIAPRQGLLRRSIHPPAAALTLCAKVQDWSSYPRRENPSCSCAMYVIGPCRALSATFSKASQRSASHLHVRFVSLSCFDSASCVRDPELRVMCTTRSRDYAVANSRRIFSALRNCHTMMTTLSSFCAARTYISTHTRWWLSLTSPNTRDRNG
jgi:hypothetical protein